MKFYRTEVQFFTSFFFLSCFSWCPRITGLKRNLIPEKSMHITNDRKRRLNKPAFRWKKKRRRRRIWNTWKVEILKWMSKTDCNEKWMFLSEWTGKNWHEKKNYNKENMYSNWKKMSKWSGKYTYTLNTRISVNWRKKRRNILWIFKHTSQIEGCIDQLEFSWKRKVLSSINVSYIDITSPFNVHVMAYVSRHVTLPLLALLFIHLAFSPHVCHFSQVQIPNDTKQETTKWWCIDFGIRLLPFPFDINDNCNYAEHHTNSFVAQPLW